MPSVARVVDDLVRSLQQATDETHRAFNSTASTDTQLAHLRTAFAIACDALKRFTGDEELRSYVLDLEGALDAGREAAEALAADPGAIRVVMQHVARLINAFTSHPIEAGMIVSTAEIAFLQAIDEGRDLDGGVEFLDDLEADICTAQDALTEFHGTYQKWAARGAIVRALSGASIKAVAIALASPDTFGLTDVILDRAQLVIVNRLSNASLVMARPDIAFSGGV